MKYRFEIMTLGVLLLLTAIVTRPQTPGHVEVNPSALEGPQIEAMYTLIADTEEASVGTAWKGTTQRPQRHLAETLDSKRLDLCLEVAREIDSDLADQLEALRMSDPTAFEARIRRSHRLLSLADLKQRDARLYSLKLMEIQVDAEVSRLACQVKVARREGRTADAQKLEDQLRKNTILQLGLRHKARDNYLCELRELVEKLDGELRREREEFNVLLEQRVNEYLETPCEVRHRHN